MRPIPLFIPILFSLLTYNSVAQSAIIENEILIQVDKSQFSEPILRNTRWANAIIQPLTTAKDFYLLKTTTQQEGKLVLAVLKQQDFVIWADYNRALDFRNEPNDTHINQQWHLEKIQAFEAWETLTGGVTANNDTIIIAFLDGGCQVNHPDLKNNIWINRYDPIDGIDNDGNGKIDDINGWNFANNSNTFTNSSHGTAVAGIIGAEGNNAIGVSGINWKVKLLPIQVASVADLVQGYDYLFQLRKKYNTTNGAGGAFIAATNASLGAGNAFPSDFPMWCPLYDSLGMQGVLNIGATTNANSNIDVTGDLPSLCQSEYLIVVTATKNDDSFNNAGYSATNVDMSAPTTGLVTTAPNDYNFNFGGTSGATPQVAGAAGLLYSYSNIAFGDKMKTKPAQFVKDLKQLILMNTDKLTALDGITVSEGRLNINKCVAALKQEYPNNFSENLGIKNLYPSPARDYVYLLLDIPAVETLHLSIYNALGQKMYEVSDVVNDILPRQRKIDVKGWAQGVYIVYFTDNKKGKAVRKFVIQ